MKLLLQHYGPRRLRFLFALATTGFIGASALAQTPARLNQALTAYDAAITADTTESLAKLTEPVTLDGTAGSPFDFGAGFGDATIEFILEGDPTTGASAFLAVGEVPASSLRYGQWQNTRQLGFTQGGVADYLFTPGVLSPTDPAHIAYVWNSAELTMSLYLNGVLAGTAANVTADFVLPSGAGILGASPGGDQFMTGTIYRVTVYPGVLPESQVQSHAAAFADVALPSIETFTATPAEVNPPGSTTLNWAVENATAVYINGAPATATNLTVSPAVTTTYTLVASNELATATSRLRVFVNPRLDLYDAAIAASATNGLEPVVTLTNAVTLNGTAGEPFDFGATSGDVTMEFILEGDPAAGPNGYLAVGEIPTSNLRYAQWQNTRQMGFTQLAVADYMFSPGVPSPTIATHVAYVWDADGLTMKIYINGVLAGTVANVSPDFAMPTGAGFLGSNPGGGEAMTGRIHRVVVYSGEVPEETIQQHATAFTSVLRPAIITSFTTTTSEIFGQGTATLNWQVQDATGIFLNGTNVTGTTNLTVSPAATTSYTLVASNAISSVSAQVRILVTPILTNYDAAITGSATNELTTPVALLTNIVTLNGTGGEPFDFGATFGDVTMEFILEGDPFAGLNGYLAVGENTTSNLRYAQWQNTQQMGFTQLGVADYMFTPSVASPTVPTHVTYVWNSTELTMTIYTNGVLAGTVTGVSPDFAMPTGLGSLGANPTGAEAMTGRIFRLAAYNGILPEGTIQQHASAFTGSTGGGEDGASLTIAVNGTQPTITLQGEAGAHYRVEYRDSLAPTATWQLLQDIPSLTGTTIQVNDPTPITGRRERYYRAVTVP